MDADSCAKRHDAVRAATNRHIVVLLFGAVASVLILAAILIPHFTVSTLARNEANAMESLHALTKLQHRYATEYPLKGFACDFVQLKTGALSNGENGHEGFLNSDSFEGYKFSLSGCEADPNGVAVRYKATAVPLQPGKTGVRAFCTDQTGELFYGASGTAESCRPL